MRKILLAIILFGLSFQLVAQHLPAWSDVLKRFYIFDKGKITQVEHVAVQSFKVGADGIIYKDRNENLKLYYNGEISVLDPGGFVKYFATDYLMAYAATDQLYVVDKGKKKLLTTYTQNYVVEDSI
ncbi:hypothetical protein, partial [Streptococcus pseudopneumoniae]|uniref:hypothetical protein n=1 Tax=Streptococcus pseudopneumoniae TaxID=257758 RepID=UPI00110C3D1A